MHFLWIDCEMTGLSFECDHILEIALILTDTSLKKISQYHAVIHQKKEILSLMNEKVEKMHTKSGLIKKIQISRKKYSEVRNDILDILVKNTKQKNTYIAGNSVYTDLLFLKKHMPKIYDWLHYRTLDVSSLKLIAQTKNIPIFKKSDRHEAIEDIRESIEEYKYYCKYLFKN